LQKQTDAEAELERLEKNIQQLKDAYQTAMDLLAERVTLQATIQSKRTERNALLTQKQALEKEIGSIQDATSVLRATALEEEINKSQALVKRKEKNDQYEKEEIEAARNEIQKMEAQLAQWDEKGDDELLDLTEKNMIIQQIHQLERTLIELQEESCKATQEIQSKQASLEKAKEQLQQLQDQRSAQTMELEQIKTECATALETNREELRQQRQREFDELERKAAICRFAKTAMEKTESRIAKYASGKYDQELFSEEKDK
jgi:chromosome segregation ATPase